MRSYNVGLGGQRVQLCLPMYGIGPEKGVRSCTVTLETAVYDRKAGRPVLVVISMPIEPIDPMYHRASSAKEPYMISRPALPHLGS